MKLPIHSTVIAAFGLLSMLLPVSQTAHAQDIRSREFVAPVVFQAAGSTAASIQSSVDAFRAAVGEILTTAITPGRSRTLAARSTGTVATPTFWIPQLR